MTENELGRANQEPIDPNANPQLPDTQIPFSPMSADAQTPTDPQLSASSQVPADSPVPAAIANPAYPQMPAYPQPAATHPPYPQAAGTQPPYPQPAAGSYPGYPQLTGGPQIPAVSQVHYGPGGPMFPTFSEGGVLQGPGWREQVLAKAKRWLSPGPLRNRIVAGAAVLAVALAGGATGGAIGYAMHSDNGVKLVSSTTSAAAVVDRSTLAGIVTAVQPSIVDITTNSAEGSGIIISSDGYVVTNNHVISGGGRTVTVTLNSGEQVSATVVGTDSQHDLAVLKVDRTGLPAATWGDSDSVLVGDTVLALGSPLGLQGTVTSGIVSALHRQITVGDEQQSPFSQSTQTTLDDAIQTDAPINSGNSGGALVNTNGDVIGITSAIATSGSSGNIGVGFAIPSATAKAVVDAIIAGQR